MPELPEVEIIRQDIEEKLTDRSLNKIIISNKSSFVSTEPLTKIIPTKPISLVSRRGKFLVVLFTDRTKLILHLRMTGQLFLVKHNIKVPNERVRFTLDSGWDWVFADIRKFGRLWYFTADDLNWSWICGIGKLGPDLLEDHISVEFLFNRAKTRKINIKKLLLDQSFVAGLGNIYVDETLFKSQISPLRPVSELTLNDWKNIYKHAVIIIKAAIKHRGTTFSDYRDLLGEKGHYREYLHVYGRGNKPCHTCSRLLTKIKVATRGTVYCEDCQH